MKYFAHLLGLCCLISTQAVMANSIFCSAAHTDKKSLIDTSSERRISFSDSDIIQKLEAISLAILRLKMEKNQSTAQQLSVQNFINSEINQIREQWPAFDQEFPKIFAEVRQKYFQQNEERKRTQRLHEEEMRRHFKEAQLKFIDGTRGIFHRIEPGSFRMGEKGRKVDVTITKPYEMMATPTTQIIWKKIAELAGEKLPGRFRITPGPSWWKGDTYPAEFISYNAIQVWIRALNELSKLHEPDLLDLFPGHKQGDVYRLPTEAEWEFVVRGRGQFNDTYPFGNDENKLGDYAWHGKNSNRQTHPVAEKLPLEFDNLKFYDMLGNLSEMVNDYYHAELVGGIDPQGPAESRDCVIRGGNFNMDPRLIDSASRSYADQNSSYNVTGFRLVREVR